MPQRNKRRKPKFISTLGLYLWEASNGRVNEERDYGGSDIPSDCLCSHGNGNVLRLQDSTMNTMKNIFKDLLEMFRWAMGLDGTYDDGDGCMSKDGEWKREPEGKQGGE